MVLCCAVKGCKREAYPGSGLTFHRIPANRRHLWIEAMKLDSKISNTASICGRHFKDEDYISPLNSKLKPEAVPSILNPKILLDPFQYITPYISRNTHNKIDENIKSEIAYSESDQGDIKSEIDHSESDQNDLIDDGDQSDSDRTYCSDVSKNSSHEKLKLDGVCRTCLCNDRTLCDISPQNEIIFQDIFDIDYLGCQSDLPKRICWECNAKLNSFSSFKAKAIQANSLLLSLIRSANTESTDLSNIDREALNLTSSLVTITFDNNYADYYIENYSEEVTVPNEPLDLQQIVENLDIGEDISAPFMDIQKLEIEEDDVQNLEMEEDNVQNLEMEEDNVQTLEMEEDNVQTLEMEEDNVQNLEIEEDNEDNLYIVPEIKENARKSVPKVQKDTGILKKRGRKKKNLNECQENGEPKIQKKAKNRKIMINCQENAELPNDLNKEIFDVKYLSMEEQLSEVLNRKNSNNYKISGFKCEECYKGFVHEDAYNLHMLKHSDQNATHCCGVCKMRFVKKRDLRRHILEHMRKFICKKCNYVSNYQQSAKLHEEYHTGTKYECPHCLKNFAFRTTYMSHLRIKHPTDIVCQLCGYSFVNDKGLKFHINRKHRLGEQQVPENGPWCKKCNIQFYNTEALEKHVELSDKHSKDELNSRKPGARRFYSLQGSGNQSGSWAKRKYSTPLTTGPITCEQCDKQLENARAYFVHFRREHPDKHRTKYAMTTQIMCEVCGKMVQSAAALRNHSYTHSDTKQFQCDSCTKQFKTRALLQSHKNLMHAETKPCFLCSECSSTFTTLSNLNKHKAKHRGLKPQQCEICAKLFTTMDGKRSHISYVHLKKPWPKRVRDKRKDTKQNLPQSTQLATTKGQPVKIYIIKKK